jgi:hypothetical protein
MSRSSSVDLTLVHGSTSSFGSLLSTDAGTGEIVCLTNLSVQGGRRKSPQQLPGITHSPCLVAMLTPPFSSLSTNNTILLHAEQWHHHERSTSYLPSPA